MNFFPALQPVRRRVPAAIPPTMESTHLSARSSRRRTCLTLFTGLLLCLFALQSEGAEKRRENTEWDVAFWYNANSNKLPRVLLLGDSICRGYESQVRDELAGVAYISYWATSKCATDRSYLKQLRYILEEYPYAVVHYNTGLHSLDTDLEKWEHAVRAVLALIREKAPNAKIIWTTSTPLRDESKSDRLRQLNEAGIRLAREAGLTVDDLHGLMAPLDRARYWTDRYHFTEEARTMQGRQVAAFIREALGGARASIEEARSALEGAASETGPDGSIETTKRAP